MDEAAQLPRGVEPGDEDCVSTLFRYEQNIALAVKATVEGEGAMPGFARRERRDPARRSVPVWMRPERLDWAKLIEAGVVG